MALTTYTELKAAIATRLHRSDLTTQIVDYVTLAEKRLNRTLKLLGRETEATLTAVVGSRSLTIPSGFGKPISLYRTTYLPREKLVYQLADQMQVYSSNGAARYWTIDGATIKTDSPADIAYTYAFRYSAEYDIASTSTNALLTRYPDCYFYGALIEASTEMKDDRAIERNERRFEQALQECLDDINASRSIAILSTDIGAARHVNIISGD